MTDQRDYGLYQKLEIVGVVTDGWSVFLLLALSFGCRFLIVLFQDIWNIVLV